MKRIKCNEYIEIESDIPIKSLLTLEIKQQLNDHGRLHFRVIIENERQRDFLQKHDIGGQVNVLDTRQQPNPWLFIGKIQSITCKQKNELLIADVHVASFSTELDQETKRRSFQNPEAMFSQVVNQVAESSSWQVTDRKTDQPFFQYEETDWNFLIRMASHFNCPIHTSLYAMASSFYFGIRKGRRQTLNEANIMEFGFSQAYYTLDGYAAGHERGSYNYLKVRHLEAWEIGDFVQFKKRKFTVIERQMIFDKAGELYYVDTLGADGLLHRPTIYNETLTSMQLEGTIERVEHESVFIRFDFGMDDQLIHSWKWMPEVGNWAYIMPEEGSRVVLTFTTPDEKDGIATHILRDSGTYESEYHRGLSNPYRKHLRLYPDLISLQGGKESIAGVSVANEGNIRIVDQVGGIRLNAKGVITFSGEQIFIQAPNQILMQTNESNIELCKNFNFYAPGGVMTTSTGGGEVEEPKAAKGADKSKSKKEDPNHWQSSYAALGAVSSTNLHALGDDPIIRLRALGSVPKISDGDAVASMSQVMAGKPVEETVFPQAISNLGAYTLNGGYRIPKTDEGMGIS